MRRLIQKYKSYFEPKSVKLIKICFLISILTCFFSLLLLDFYNTYFISINLYKSSLTLFRTGIMIGIFPCFFAIIIGKYKQDRNL